MPPLPSYVQIFPYLDVVRAASEAGFPGRTLYRARQALADVIVDLGNSPHDPNKRWTLAVPPNPTPSPE